MAQNYIIYSDIFHCAKLRDASRCCATLRDATRYITFSSRSHAHSARCCAMIDSKIPAVIRADGARRRADGAQSARCESDETFDLYCSIGSETTDISERRTFLRAEK